MKHHPFDERAYFFAETDNKTDKPKTGLAFISIFMQNIPAKKSNVLLNLHYFINPLALVANIFTAIANNITPKNFLIIIIPFGPNAFSIHFNDFNTR